MSTCILLNDEAHRCTDEKIPNAVTTAWHR